MDGKKRVLPRIFGGGARKPARIEAAQPCVQFPEQLLIGPAVASLRGGHEAAPSPGTNLPILGPDCLPLTNCGIGRRGPQRSIADAIARSGNAAKIALAQSEMAKAAVEISSGRFDKAIDHFKTAWGEATNA